MAKLTADRTSTLNGVTVKEFLLTKHNPNNISMPTASMKGKVIGVTIHNTDDLENVYEDAEQYTRATYNGNMKSVRAHYYVDDVNAWQNLPLTLAGWHAADGSGKGNRRTIAIECIMTGKNEAADRKAEDNAARLAAALLKQHGLGIESLYTHTHWLNVKDGKKGTVDQLNVMSNSYKNCPAYILPHWNEFKAKVAEYLGETQETTSEKPESAEAASTSSSNLYRVRKGWNNVASQIGAYKSLGNAVAACKSGYAVYDSNGVAVHTAQSESSQGTYKVKVTADALNIRAGAGTSYKITGCIRDKGVYTIIQTSGTWGKLKSGAGWISLKYTKKL